MPRRILASPALALVALVLAAPAAPAKEISQALVCGASGCRDATDRFGHDEAAMQSGAIDPGPAKRAPFYRVRFRIGDGTGVSYGGWRLVYVPSLRLTSSYDAPAGQRVWSRMTPESVRIYRRAVRGIAPLPARRLPMPREGGDQPNGALPPEVVAPPAAVRHASGGFDAWPGLALLVPLGGAVALLARRRRTHRRDDTGAPPAAA